MQFSLFESLELEKLDWTDERATAQKMREELHRAPKDQSQSGKIKDTTPSVLADQKIEEISMAADFYPENKVLEEALSKLENYDANPILSGIPIESDKIEVKDSDETISSANEEDQILLDSLNKSKQKRVRDRGVHRNKHPYTTNQLKIDNIQIKNSINNIQTRILEIDSRIEFLTHLLDGSFPSYNLKNRKSEHENELKDLQARKKLLKSSINEGLEA